MQFDCREFSRVSQTVVWSTTAQKQEEGNQKGTKEGEGLGSWSIQAGGLKVPREAGRTRRYGEGKPKVYSACGS